MWGPVPSINRYPDIFQRSHTFGFVDKAFKIIDVGSTGNLFKKKKKALYKPSKTYHPTGFWCVISKKKLESHEKELRVYPKSHGRFRRNGDLLHSFIRGQDRVTSVC